MSTIGTSCGGGSTTRSAGNTWMYQTSSISANATITQWCINLRSLNNTNTAKLKVFRANGSNWDLIAEDIVTITGAGATTKSCSISVLSGDYVGVYTDCNGYCGNIEANSGTSFKMYTGEVTGTTAQSSWSSQAEDISFIVTYAITIDNVYINSSTGNDSNDGTSCVNAVLTFQTAYNLLNSAGTIYICNDGADFSGENITFTKPYSTAQGATGVTNCKLPRFN